MHHLTIHRLYFTQSDCYNAGVKQKSIGVQVHSTGANNPYLKRYVQPDDGLLGKNMNGNSHNRPGGNVCANAYIGKLQNGSVAVYQTLPWDYRCWLSGSGPKGNANKLGYIGFEICEDSTENRGYFDEAVRGAAVLLTAYLCDILGGIYPYSDKLEDHAGLHGMGLASNHGDIGLWLKKFGYTFDDFRDWVASAMVEGVKVEYVEAVHVVEHPTLRRGDSGEAVVYLQTLLCDTGDMIPVDGKFGQKTEASVRAFQQTEGLTVDGIVGAKTWSALEKATGHDAEPDPPTGDPAVPDDEEIPDDIVIIPRDDWNALRAAYAVMGQVIKKYDAVG